MKLRFVRPFSGGLFARIVILVSLLITFIVSLNTMLAIRRETGILTKGLIDKNIMLINHLSGSIQTAFMSLDWYSVQHTVTTSTDAGEVLYCRIVKPDGEIFMADDKNFYGRKMDEPIPPGLQDLSVKDTLFEGTQERVKLIVKPVLIGKERWSIWLAVSLKPIDRVKMSIIFQNLIEGVLIVLLGAFITFRLSRNITRPIGMLAGGARQVSDGNLDCKIEISRKDEIGQLASAFNRMTKQLGKNRDELNAYSNNLEDIVKERTQKLLHEINERKAAERKRKRLEAQLQRAQKMEAIGTLAGGVAHDLNNILSGLISYPELILLELPEESHFRPMVKAVKESGERAASIVQDLLTLARRGVAVKEVLNLNHIILNCLTTPEYEKVRRMHAGMEVETDLDDTLLNISGSQVHISKTITNLIHNSAESISGEGRISIRTANEYIDKPVAGYTQVEEGDYAVVTISDNGEGLCPQDKERIFEPFYTRKVMGRSGTGLGMAVVWGTVQDHDGYIDVKSAKGIGTAITLYFPVTRQIPAEKSPLEGSPVEHYRGNGERILVVDDVAEQTEIATEILSRLNYAVTTVKSGEAAVAYLKENSVDLVILDMIMDPGMDGAQTYQEITKLHPGQKAIIVSGFSESNRVKEAQSLGAGAYVKKPYMFEKLGAAVKAELSS